MSSHGRLHRLPFVTQWFPLFCFLWAPRSSSTGGKDKQKRILKMHNFFLHSWVDILLSPSLCRSWYFCIHIGCILLAIVLPVKPRHLRLKEQQPAVQPSLESTDSNSNQKQKATWVLEHLTNLLYTHRLDRCTYSPATHEESQINYSSQINQPTKLCLDWQSKSSLGSV